MSRYEVKLGSLPFSSLAAGVPTIDELATMANDSGAGSRLPTPLLVMAGASAVVAVLVSTVSILLQLRNYRKPALQRMVVRIMVMVPLYAIASLISLFSVEAAFFIDAIRDIYEAFVIYCFFLLLLSYLGGERSLLILLHGRPPKEPPFPVSLFKREIDVSDPYTFLFLKRGILQYVQVKPVLAAVTMILKAVGKFNEGDFRANSGYLYVSIVYNVSICLSLYCLAIFWICVNDDLKPFRILFFSFWQSVLISTLVATHVITRLGPYTDPENVSDFIDPMHTFVARMPMYYAFRDAFGALDVIEDSKTTLRGEGMDYREFEPAEGFMHQGAGRDRRIRAGLRYSRGGQGKYWLPKTTDDTRPAGRTERAVNKVIRKFAGDDQTEDVRAPLLSQEAEDVVHLAPDMQADSEDTIWDDDGDDDLSDGYGLPFGDLEDADEELFAHSRQYLFGDYNYPCIDVSSESARTVIWDEEERVLRDERGAWFSPLRGAKGQVAIQKRNRPAWEGYGAVGDSGHRSHSRTRMGSRMTSERFYDNRSGNIIDHEQDRNVVSADPRDLNLRYTNSRKSAGSNTQSPQVRYVQRSNRHTPSSSPGLSSSASGSGSGSSPANRHGWLSPPVLSRSNSRTVQGGGSPVLPPDAVDLVVEDPHAMEEEQTRERRKGEPSTRGSGLRKVYRRGFVEVDAGGGDADTLGDEDQEDREDDERYTYTPRQSSEWAHEVEVRTTHYDIPDHDNPWAS
ncbi:DUF300 domain-containing protein [Pholiota molesta]|nr:DUF300 domain-containing protein [Pholiota molesta]